MRLPKFKNKRRAIIIAAAGALTLVGGGIAAAYFTATGSGTGHASVGTTIVWTVSASATSGSILGTGHGQKVIAFTIKNNTGSPGYSETYGTQSVAVTGLPAGCPTGSFTVARTGTTPGSLVAGGGSLGAGASATYNALVTVATLGSGTAQTSCESGTVTVTLTVNG